ncbi:MAG: transcriptional repressor LexA [Thermodesulfobacteriota bacterium]|nr:transcriptional repressor LexA [Thermodesulfobacteriota bacterium]
MKKDLTPRQKAILQYIADTIERKGYSPTIREIGQETGISSLEGVLCHLRALEKKGRIKRDSSHRSIRILSPDGGVTRRSEETVKLPLLGRIAAGEPILAPGNVEDNIPVPKFLVKGNGDTFLLKVKGDSMKDDHILDGDLIVTRHQVDAENGEIVAAVIDGEATVKRFYREQDHVRLQPANPDYEPIILRRDFQICGKVIGLLRLEVH